MKKIMSAILLAITLTAGFAYADGYYGGYHNGQGYHGQNHSGHGYHSSGGGC